MFNKKDYAVGIDIGNHFIKIVRLIYNESYIGVDRYIIQRTPNQIISKGIIQYPEDLGKIIQAILIEQNIKCKRASVSIPLGDETVILKWIDLPNFKKREMGKALDAMIEDEFRTSKENLYYNWTKIKEKKVDKQEGAEVIVAGATRDCVDNMVSTLKLAKMKPYYLEPDIFSILRCLKLQPNENVAIIDLSATLTKINIIEKNIFTYSRNIPYGGFEWVNRIMEFQGFDIKSAEKELMTNATISLNMEELSLEQQALCDILSEPIDEMFDEVINTLDFYQERYKTTINSIIFTGSGSRVNGLISYAEEKIGIPCKLIEPYFASKLDVRQKNALEKVWPSIAVATGLALKEVTDNV